MVKFSVFYPNEPGKKFDWDYYLNNHIPLAHRLLDPAGLVRSEVDKGVGSAEAPATFIGAVHMYFNSMDDFQNGFAAHGGELMMDMPNYTDVQPQVQVSEVVR